MHTRYKYHKAYRQQNKEIMKERNKLWMREYRKLRKAKGLKANNPIAKREKATTYEKYLKRTGIKKKYINMTGKLDIDSGYLDDMYKYTDVDYGRRICGICGILLSSPYAGEVREGMCESCFNQ